MSHGALLTLRVKRASLMVAAGLLTDVKRLARRVTDGRGQPAAIASAFSPARGPRGTRHLTQEDTLPHHEGIDMWRVPLNREAREALLARARFRATHCPESPWVFCRQDGSRIARIMKGFLGCARAADLDDLHPHDLRRTFGSWLVQGGIGIERVSELLRHGDVAITARVYAHLRPGDLADAVAILDRPERCGSGTHLHTDLHTGTSEVTADKKKPQLSG